MTALLNSPLFGIGISVLAFQCALIIYRRFRIALCNPLLVSVIIITVFLSIFHISFATYNKGGRFISYFLGPTTVILAVPLYQQLSLLKDHFIPIIVGITVGSVVSITSVFFLTKLFGITGDLAVSLLPKSITTPIGIEVAKQIGGIPSVTAGAIIVTGMIGAVIGPLICKLFGIRDEVAVGIAMGTSAHAIGTTKAIELGPVQGAMSGLAIGLAGFITVILVPFLLKIL
ncbi:LrgB family protein [Thermincola ferriacetica]|uniref:LrgB family protein n=1 Tax=Thermincola ferriacetica TaxID=281456 RepID=A0A0L6W1M2_9FIRM|nr:LrgB family protein [Thermincola ferriacetica]KNZ68969.1 LrgB family protein [Thermincola ferriacetica]